MVDSISQLILSCSQAADSFRLLTRSIPLCTTTRSLFTPLHLPYRLCRLRTRFQNKNINNSVFKSPFLESIFPIITIMLALPFYILRCLRKKWKQQPLQIQTTNKHYQLLILVTKQSQCWNNKRKSVYKLLPCWFSLIS